MRDWFVGFSVSIAGFVLGGALVTSLIYIIFLGIAWVFNLISPVFPVLGHGIVYLAVHVPWPVWVILVVLSWAGYVWREDFSRVGKEIRGKYVGR
jgi:hypothetical protein